ncbi:MAG TPA: hypothetical protein VF984_03555 [Actinomycetota bacterium]
MNTRPLKAVRFVAVGALVLAALVAPIALPVRMFAERARRRKSTVEQVVPVRRQGLPGTA